MYERQFGLRENPFSAGHQSKYVYPSREHQEALAHLRFGIENREAFVLITGEVGTGKTTALYDALSEWKSRAVVALITNTALTRSELYEEICMRFGVPIAGPTSKPQLIQQLERHLLVVRARGDYAILLIDEAQNLDSGLLEETRLLSNLEAQGHKLLQIFLVGQPELEEKLAQPELRQLRQRIAVHYQLRPLSMDDTERYIHHRISVAGGHALTVFPSDACAEVHASTHGIPREINTVAAQALLNAFVEDATSVRPEHVRAIVHDTGFQSVLDSPAARATSASAVAVPTTPPNKMSPPAAASPVPVSPSHDAPAQTREVRQVPAPAPAAQRGTGTGPPTPIEPEGYTMAGVRPAGSTESWQSWMQSLAGGAAEQTEGKPGAGADAADAATTENGAPAPTHSDSNEVRPEMTPEEFYAVEEAALRAPIGDEEFEDAVDTDEAGDASDLEAAETRSDHDGFEGPSDLVTEVVQEMRFEALETPPAASQGEDITWLHELADKGSSTPEQPARASTMPGRPAHLEGGPGMNWAAADNREEGPAVARPLEGLEGIGAPLPPAPAAERPEPATARVSAAPAQPMPTAKALPIRLRERLEAAEREEDSDSSRMTGWLIGIAAVAAVTIAVLLALKFRSQANTPTKTPAEVAATSTTETSGGETPASGVATTAAPSPTPAAPEKTTAPSATVPAPPPVTTSGEPNATATTEPPRTQPAAAKPNPASSAANRPAAATVKPAATPSGTTPSQSAVVKPDAPAPAASKPALSKPPVAAVVAPVVPKAAAPKPAAPKSQFGVSVASFLAEGRAKTELARLTASTRISGRVVTTPDGDYRVVLGSYPNRAAAENAAGDLINSGKVDEARVVSLGSAAKK